jgi:hypothetical protein
MIGYENNQKNKGDNDNGIECENDVEHRVYFLVRTYAFYLKSIVRCGLFEL